MAELTDAAPWVEPHLWNRAVVLDGEVVEPPTREALTPATLAWLAQLAAEVRADERAKVAEEVAVALQAYGDQLMTENTPVIIVSFVDTAAAIARQHAVQGSARHQEATNGPDAYPSEGEAVPSPQKAAQEGER